MCYLPVDGKTGTLSSGEDFLENSEEAGHWLQHDHHTRIRTVSEKGHSAGVRVSVGDWTERQHNNPQGRGLGAEQMSGHAGVQFYNPW